MGDEYCEVCGNPVDNPGEFCSSACEIKYLNGQVEMLNGAIEGWRSTTEAKDSEIAGLNERIEELNSWDDDGKCRCCGEENISRFDAEKRRADAAEARAEELEEVIRESIKDLATCEHTGPDPQYGDKVRRLGEYIGFGALMSAASWEWRQRLAIKGGEFIAGPCRATYEQLMKRLRAAIDEAGGE